MKAQQKMLNVAISSLDRCNCELKSIMNHSDDINPDVLAKINRAYYDLCALCYELQDLEEEL